MQFTKCYKYRLMPTPAQEAAFLQFAGCRRFVWNWALARRNEVYKATGKGISAYSLSAELTQLKKQPETAFLQECQAQLLQATLQDLDKAFGAFFAKRARFPRFKSRKRCTPAFRFPQHVSISSQAVTLPKIGKVKAIIHRTAEGVLKSATIKQEAGAWYVVFVSHSTGPDFPPTYNNPVGLDVGLTTFVTLSTGEKVKPPKFARKAEKKTARLARALARCERGSKRLEKAKARLAKHHAQTANRRGDFLHKLSARIVSEHDTICIEDLNVAGLARNKRVAKSFNDAALSAFLHQLEYKAAWNCGQVVKVGRFFPSSKTCYGCGLRANLTLSDRVWTCAGCGAKHDRDLNAAQNIKAEGLRILGSAAAGIAEAINALGATVRPATAGALR